MDAHGDIVPFRVLCAVRTRLRSRWWFRCTLLFVRLFASKASSSGKHDMGALSWLNVETLERAPTPLFGRLASPLGALSRETTVYEHDYMPYEVFRFSLPACLIQYCSYCFNIYLCMLWYWLCKSLTTPVQYTIKCINNSYTLFYFSSIVHWASKSNTHSLLEMNSCELSTQTAWFH